MLADNTFAMSPPVFSTTDAAALFNVSDHRALNRLGRAIRQPVWRMLEDAAVTAELTRLETPPSKQTRKCDSWVTEGDASRAFSWAVCDRCNTWRKRAGAPLDESERFDCAMVKRLCAESEDEMSAGEEEVAGTRVRCSRMRVGSCEGRAEQFAGRKKCLVSSRHIAAWALCDECSKWRKLSKRQLPFLEDETARFECAMIRRMCAHPEDEMSDDEVWDERVAWKLNELAVHVLTEVDIASQQAEMVQADVSDTKPQPRQRRAARAARVVQQHNTVNQKHREHMSRLVSDVAAQRRQRQPVLSKGSRRLRFASDCTGVGGSVLGTYHGLMRAGIDATHAQGTEDLDSSAGKHARRIAMAREDIFGKGSDGSEGSDSKEGGCVLIGADARSTAIPIPDNVLLVTSGMICRNHSGWCHEPAPEETDAVCSEHVVRVNAQQSVRIALMEEVPGFVGPSLDHYLANLNPRFDSHAFTMLNGTGAGDHLSRHRLHVLSTASGDTGALQAACVFARLLSPKERNLRALSSAKSSKKRPRSFSFQTGVSENWFNGSELSIHVNNLCAYNCVGNIAVFHGPTGVFLCVSSTFLAVASGFPMHWQSVYRTSEAARIAGLSNAQSPRKEAAITEALGRELLEPTHWTSYPCLRESEFLGRGRALPSMLSTKKREANGSGRDFSLKARIVWFDRLLDGWFLSPVGYEFARAKPPETLDELISDFAPKPADGQRGGFPSRSPRGNRLKPVTCAVTLRRLAHASRLTDWERRRAQLQAEHYGISF